MSCANYTGSSRKRPRTIAGTLLARRELLQVLVTRALQSRYRGAALGYLWTLLTPLLLMITYSVVFSIYFRVEIESYPAFLFSGLIPWLWFASSLQDGTPAVVQGANLIGRSRFDPELLPAVTILGGLAHCVLSLPLVLAFAWLVGRPIGWGVLLVPVLLLLQLLLTIGPVTILSAWNVYFRDVQQFVPTAVQILFLSTPILYPASIVPEGLRMVVALNPWYHLASAYQDVLYYGRLPGPWGLLFVALAGLVLHAGCEWAFAHYRERLAEEL